MKASRPQHSPSRVASCQGKVSYPTAPSAIRAMRHVNTRESKRREKLAVYRCKHCTQWHLGRAQF